LAEHRLRNLWPGVVFAGHRRLIVVTDGSVGPGYWGGDENFQPARRR
jgi:hypothetical protein